MALPRPTTSWMSGFDLTDRLFDFGSTDYELYEEDDEFVLSVEMPGFDADEIDLAWDDGVLNVAAQQESERGRRTYHRRFRFPKDIDDESITAEYTNGVLEVRLPVVEEETISGREIEIEG